MSLRSNESEVELAARCRSDSTHSSCAWGVNMIILGIILMVLGFVFSVPILWTIGIVVLVIGLVLWLLGAIGRPVAGRKYYY